MRVVAIILALAAGASGCPCTTAETPAKKTPIEGGVGGLVCSYQAPQPAIRRR